MCRYAIHNYKKHYACFACRLAFKPHKSNHELNRCPNCGGEIYSIGLDFKAQKKHDRIAWKAAQLLYAGGVIFHSCGCNGPGYRPAHPREVDAFLATNQIDKAADGERLLLKFKARQGE